MRLSVVIPTLNEVPLISDALTALQALRQAGHEIIVADGGSEDGTVGLAQTLADRVITAPRGRATQMNVGARAAHGDVLLFLHADTCLPTDTAGLIAAATASGAEWGWFAVRLSGHTPLLRVIEWSMNWRARLTDIATGDQAIFVGRELFQNLGGYPELPLMEDIALCKLLRKRARARCLHGPAITSSRRWEQYGVLRTMLLMWRLRLAYFFGADPARLEARYGSKIH